MSGLWIAGGAAFIAAAMQAGGSLVLQPLMKDVVAVQAQTIWDVGNKAQDAEGNPDGSKMTPADWQKIADAATLLRDASRALANAPGITVAAPDGKIQDEDASGSLPRQKIQAIISADPKGFGDEARKLAGVADETLAAAAQRDAAKFADASGKIDEICEACHQKFWYPQQK